MAIHPGRTKSMVIASRQKHQLKPPMLKLTLGTNIIEQVCEHRVHEVTLEEELKWQSYTDYVCEQLARNLFSHSVMQAWIVAKCFLKPTYQRT